MIFLKDKMQVYFIKLDGQKVILVIFFLKFNGSEMKLKVLINT